MFIPKKDKTLCKIKNWQPISLVNCDFKIIAKSIDNRITRSLSSMITSDKTGFQKTWSISKNNFITLCYGNSRPTKRYIAGNTSLQTQLIYLTTHNIILTTRSDLWTIQYMCNYQTMLSLMLLKLTIKESSLRSTQPWSSSIASTTPTISSLDLCRESPHYNQLTNSCTLELVSP